MHGKKILGKASKDEKEAMCKIVSKAISKLDSKRTEEQIYSKIGKKLKVIFTEQLPKFSGSVGMQRFNTIYIDKDDFDKMVNSKPEELQDSFVYNTIVHECIHKLQKTKILYKGKSVRGFVEGATELFASRATYRNRSTFSGDGIFSCNFPSSPYLKETSIIAQLEVLYGKEIVEDYALRQDTTLFEKLIETVGEENFNTIAKDMHLSVQGKEPLVGFFSLQNIIMNNYFEKQLRNVNTKEAAEEYLEQLKQLDKVRLRKKGDNSYKEYYERKLEELSQKFSELDTKKYAYKQAEFYPVIYFDEQIKEMDSNTLDTFWYTEDVEEFKNIDLDEYKRYRYIQDGKIFEMITKRNEPYKCQTIDEHGYGYVGFIFDNGRRFIKEQKRIRYFC